MTKYDNNEKSLGIVKLPFDLSPKMKTYHIMAHPLGIIGGCVPEKDKWGSWLFNKYINCYYTETPTVKFDVHESDKLFFEDNVFDYLEFTITVSAWKDMLNIDKTSFLERIIGFIKRGYYIWGTYNERYIRAKSKYKDSDFLHDYLLFGYDAEKEVFYSAGYTSRNVYEEYEIAFDEYYDSIFQTYYNRLLLRVLKFNQEASFNINIEGILRDMQLFLESKVFKPSAPPDSVYGINATYKLIEYMKHVEKIDIRFTKVLLEQKSLMYERLKYLHGIGIISGSICQNYAVIQADIEKAYLLSQKYNITGQDVVKDRCIHYIESAIECEKELIICAIQEIKESKIKLNK